MSLYTQQYAIAQVIAQVIAQAIAHVIAQAIAHVIAQAIAHVITQAMHMPLYIHVITQAIVQVGVHVIAHILTCPFACHCYTSCYSYGYCCLKRRPTAATVLQFGWRV